MTGTAALDCKFENESTATSVILLFCNFCLSFHKIHLWCSPAPGQTGNVMSTVQSFVPLADAVFLCLSFHFIHGLMGKMLSPMQSFALVPTPSFNGGSMHLGHFILFIHWCCLCVTSFLFPIGLASCFCTYKPGNLASHTESTFAF